jgi:GxxExxY protein
MNDQLGAPSCRNAFVVMVLRTLQQKISSSSAPRAAFKNNLDNANKSPLQMSFKPLTDTEEIIGKQIVNASFKIHKELGPGLLEKVYETCLEHEIRKSGFDVERQVLIPIKYDGIVFSDALRLDLLVEKILIIEVKSVETVHEVWQAQILSHLKLTDLRLGYLINFNVSLIKNGIRRFVK